MNISEWWPRAVVKRNATPATSSAITEGGTRPTEDGDRNQAPAKYLHITLYDRTWRGAWRSGLAITAQVPKAVAGGDSSGARPNWSTIAAWPEKQTSSILGSRERLDSSGEQGPLRQRVTASPMLSTIYAHPWVE